MNSFQRYYLVAAPQIEGLIQLRLSLPHQHAISNSLALTWTAFKGTGWLLQTIEGCINLRLSIPQQLNPTVLALM